MKLYADYIKERENAEVVYNDFGFMSYKVETLGTTILDAYVVPEKRKSNIAKNFLMDIAEKTNSKKLYTNTDENANGWQISEKVILALGFKKIGKINTCNYYIKEIK